MQEPATIRRAGPRDCAALARLFRAEIEAQRELSNGAFDLRPEFDWTEWVRAKLNAPAGAVFVAESGEGTIAGFAEARFRAAATGAPAQSRKGWLRRLRAASPPPGSPAAPVALGFVEEVFVLPEWRRQGIASRLVGAAVDWLESRGATEIAASIWRENAASQALFTRAGFGASRVVMSRRVSRDDHGRSR